MGSKNKLPCEGNSSPLQVGPPGFSRSQPILSFCNNRSGRDGANEGPAPRREAAQSPNLRACRAAARRSEARPPKRQIGPVDRFECRTPAFALRATAGAPSLASRADHSLHARRMPRRPGSVLGLFRLPRGIYAGGQQLPWRPLRTY